MRYLQSKYVMKNAVSGFVLGLVGVLTFNYAVAQERNEPDATATEPGTSAVVSDAWISTKIKASLVPLMRDHRASIGVEVAGGAVVLSGTVEGEVTRQQVIALCAQTRGVTAVEAAALKIAGFPSVR